MRPYSSGVSTWAAAKSVQPFEPGVAGWGTAGALLPDVPAVAGAVWLAVRRLDRFSHKEFGIEVCGRKLFCGPEAALHPALPVAALLAVYTAPDTRARDPRGALLAFLLAWTGHVIVDSLTRERCASDLLAAFREALCESDLLLGPRPPNPPRLARRTRNAPRSGREAPLARLRGRKREE